MVNAVVVLVCALGCVRASGELAVIPTDLVAVDSEEVLKLAELNNVLRSCCRPDLRAVVQSHGKLAVDAV